MPDSADSHAPRDTIELAPGVTVAGSTVAFVFTTSRGPGGQNVNKRATRAEMRVALHAIPIPADARARLAALLGRRVSVDGCAVITSGEHRSQARNRAECVERLRTLVVRALVRPRARRATRPSRASIERRIEAKRRRGATKRARASDEE